MRQFKTVVADPPWPYKTPGQMANKIGNYHMNLPPTNATLHILSHENGSGTPDREFVAYCGTSWKAVGSTNEHKYLFEFDTQWFKHVNCPKCREIFGLDITS